MENNPPADSQIPKLSVLEPQVEKPVVGNADTPEVQALVNAKSTVQQAMPPKKKLVNLPKITVNRKVWIVGGILLAAFILALVIPAIFVFASATKAYKTGRNLEKAFKEQDLTKVKTELETLKKDLAGLRGTYSFLVWTKPVPLLGAYWSDGSAAINAGIYGTEAGEIVVTTLEPYADIIGFKGGGGATSGAENANDRIEFIVETIDQITPKLGDISKKAEAARDELNKINPDRYPEKVGKTKVRENIDQVIKLANEGTTLITDGKPLLEAAPYLLGIDSERTYLILFQNDKELRPTGGFLTAYSIATVEKGKFNPVSSNDIYNLDARYRPSVPAPQHIIDYIKGPYTLSKNLKLRDMNDSPDFKESMDLFMAEAKKAGIDDVDGVIAVDTQVVVYLLDVLGEIGVPGYGNFSSKTDPECNCPQVVHELEKFADVEGPIVWDPAGTGKIIYAPANIDNRKKIVGPLMNSVLSNALGQPAEKLPALFEAGYKSLTEKHVLLYFFDETAQGAAESFNVAGRINEFDGDYLHINDSNLGGRKSNLYVTQEVKQEVSISKDGTIQKTLELTYKNPQDYDGWLNSVLPNWTRIYVPKGSTLVDAQGFDDPGETYEELGKTVFSGGFELRPQGVKKITLTYKLPFKANREYKLFIQKQPGTDKPLHTVKVGKKEEEFFLRTDKELKFRI